MKLRWDLIFDEPLEIAHLDSAERAALVREAIERSRRSAWGWVYRAVGVAMIAVQMLVLMAGFEMGQSLWLSLIAIAGFMVVPPVWLALADARRTQAALRSLALERGIRPVVCFQCGYDLRQIPGDACPECGDAIAKPPQRN